MLKRLVANRTFQGVAVQGFTAVFAFANIALLTRILPESIFGSFMLFLTIINVGEGLRGGYGQSFYQRWYHRKAALRTELLGHALNNAAWLCIPIILLAVFGAYYLYTNPIILLLIALHFVLSIPQSVFLWDAYTTLNYKSIFICRAIFYSGFIVLVCLLHSKSLLNLEMLILLWSALTVLSATPFLFFLVRRNGGWVAIAKKRKASTMLGKVFKRFGVFSSLSSGLGIMLRSSDPIMIALFLSKAHVAWFTVPQKLMEIPEILTRSIALNFAKKIAAISNKKNRTEVFRVAKKEMIKGFGIMLLVVVILGASGYFVLQILAPEFALKSYRILLCMLPYLLFLIADRVSGVLLDFFGLPQFNSIKVSVMLLVNIVGNFVALYWFQSLYMVAAVSSITFVAGTVFGWRKLNKLHIRHA